MRIWSLHPKYLDSKGLVALWRETLLAKKVLEGKTKGYRNHPQLIRFRAAENCLSCINQYLAEVYLEAERRNYSFDKSKINWAFNNATLFVTAGQLAYEARHLTKKLKVRDPKKLKELKKVEQIEPHPLFILIAGDIETWERIDTLKPGLP